jgi:alpha-beta hydrolase superfamily lysophospholipase
MKTFSFVMIAVAPWLISEPIRSPAAAQVQPYPSSFHTRRISTNGVTLYVRVGGKGPAVLLLHGYGETGDMWTPVAPRHRAVGRDH